MENPIRVVAAIIEKEGYILCTQRNRHAQQALKWEFPGGKVEPNETPQNALIREIKEELKCDIIIGAFVGTSTYTYEFGTIELTAYLCSLGNSKVELTEHEALRWLLPTQLDTLDWAAADKPLIKLIQNILNKR